MLSCRTVVPELRVGVLAIQGGFEAHLTMLGALGAELLAAFKSLVETPVTMLV